MPRLSRLSRSIEGRTALVTGAAGGMGRATAQLFADEGARVAVVDVQAEGVERVVGEIGAAGGVARGYPTDLAEAARIPALVERVGAELGPLDILVNNAGVAFFAAIDADDYESIWERTLAVNLAAQARTIRAALPQLEREGQGRIVNIASTEALGATARHSPYAASKAGVAGLTRSLAVELGRRGVTVNCICPGPIRTPMTEQFPEEDKRKFARRRVPLRRYGEPEEVAQMTLSFVLPAASYLNGVVVPVDGGMMAQNT